LNSLEDKWFREPPRSRWRGPLRALVPLVAVLAIACGLVVLENGGQPSPSASIGPSAGPSAFDPDHLVVGTETYSILLRDGSLVVADSTGGATAELGRAQAPAGADASPPTMVWEVAVTMQCGSGDSLRLYFFGHVSTLDRGDTVTYVGALAAGGIAKDGRFLFVLPPGSGTGQRLEIDVNGQSSISTSTSVGHDGDPGVIKQASGCLVAG
jgi:hypothetical protein